MRLHQLQMALLVPDDSLLCFWSIKNIFCFAKRNIFHGWYVVPSINVFTFNGASLVPFYLWRLWQHILVNLTNFLIDWSFKKLFQKRFKFSPHWLAACPERILLFTFFDDFGFESGISIFFSLTPEMDISEVRGLEGTVGVAWKCCYNFNDQPQLMNLSFTKWSERSELHVVKW